MNIAGNSNPTPPSVPLAPGFRFHPTDEELVIYYLKRKLLGRPLRLDAIAEIDLYKFEPWELPSKSRIRCRDLEWYFFSPLDRKYSNKSKTNRATAQGYWKTTGKDREVKRGDLLVGMKKTLVFHVGRAPYGKRTNWVMHEYRIDGEGLNDDSATASVPQDMYVVCRIFQKNGSGPQNGAQYGAPFVEEEWDVETGEEPSGSLPVLVSDTKIEEFNDTEEQEYLQMNDFSQGPLNPSEQPDTNASNLLEASPVPLKQEPVYTNENADQINEPISDWRFRACSKMDQTLNGFELEGRNLQEIFNIEEFFNTVDETSTNGEDSQDTASGEDGGSSYLQSDDLPRSPLPCDYDFADGGKTVFYDLAANESLPGGMELDDLMAYFDSTEVDIKYDIPVSVEKSEDCGPHDQDQSEFAPKVEDDTTKACNADFNTVEQKITMHTGESSSVRPFLKRKTDDFTSLSGDECGDKSIRKRLVSMLGSISAPQAIASEHPVGPAKSVASISSAGPIRVTAGMIQIRGLTLTNSMESWSLEKNGDSSFLLSYSLSDDLLSGKSRVRVSDPVSKIHGGVVSIVLRSGFYLFLVSAVILTLSYKLGMCIRGW